MAIVLLEKKFPSKRAVNIAVLGPEAVYTQNKNENGRCIIGGQDGEGKLKWTAWAEISAGKVVSIG